MHKEAQLGRRTFLILLFPCILLTFLNLLALLLYKHRNDDVRGAAKPVFLDFRKLWHQEFSQGLNALLNFFIVFISTLLRSLNVELLSLIVALRRNPVNFRSSFDFFFPVLGAFSLNCIFTLLFTAFKYLVIFCDSILSDGLLCNVSTILDLITIGAHVLRGHIS